MYCLNAGDHVEEFTSLNDCMLVARSYIKSGYIVKVFGHDNKNSA